MKQFENMTIGQLRKLTEQFKKLEEENVILKRKYPNRLKQEKGKNAEEIVNDLNQIN